MNRMDVQRNSFRLGTLALLVSMVSLFSNNAFSTLLGASEQSWFLALVVLSVCILDVIATYMERSWWPYMFYLSALLFSPTIVGLSKADWLKWFGVSGGVGIFKSSLPEVVCFFVGALIVAGYLLSWGAERVGAIGTSLTSEGANPAEVNDVTKKAFAHLSSQVLTLVITVAAIWLLSLVLGDLLKGSLSAFFIPIALAAGIALIVLFYWASIKERKREEKSS